MSASDLGDLRARLAAHPMLDGLTNRQLDAIVDIVRAPVVDSFGQVSESLHQVEEARIRRQHPHPQPDKGQTAPLRRPTPPKGGGVPPPKHPQPGGTRLDDILTGDDVADLTEEFDR